MDDVRKVEILKSGEWKEVAFPDLKDGDIFRMFEPNGDPVISNVDGTIHWKVAGEPYLNEENIWTVQHIPPLCSLNTSK
jgi:hypothetical protein